MKKYIIIMGMMLLLSITTPVHATIINNGTSAIEDTTTINARAEKLAWYHRIYNGRVQKRCWSITYGYWKTAWINA